MTHGRVENLSQNEFPTLVWAWTGDRLAVDEPGTHFGFVYAGAAVLRCSAGVFPLKTGMYFAVPGELSIEQGSGMIVSRLGFRGLFHLGGPVENVGRLRYIDGCTDSLLIPPVTRGDPCLNLLHLPPGTRQSPHTHPSLRAGMVFRGEGYCATAEHSIELSPGQIFVIRAGGLHSFHTRSSSLLVLAYHPDSDFGPTHENHPMVNRTMIAEN
jgi:quercetin dioxygenase-like cupin family protein